ncbi:MAG: cytidylate kinase family protein [Nitrososphaerota archaeon]|nr:cytidylate kinase family protein [Candidatus Bathyarchaeota archaeon]MDW8048110.1 cytidylate kinase family protein [Nitrososphaerota archaeon]
MTQDMPGPCVRKQMVICICGLAGSGKSTVAKRLAKHYGLKYYSGGDALKAIAAEMGYKVTRRGWWESSEGIRFIDERQRNLNLDRKVDEKLLEWARLGGVVLDSWAMPWLVKDGFKVWLEASEEERARRIAIRDGISVEEALKFLREKEEKTRAIYKELYGFSLGEDFTPFHLIIDVESLSKNEVFQAIRMVIDDLVLRRRQEKPDIRV